MDNKTARCPVCHSSNTNIVDKAKGPDYGKVIICSNCSEATDVTPFNLSWAYHCESDK